MKWLFPYTWLVMAFLSLTLPAQGQPGFGVDKAMHIAYLQSIKQLGEFINRFNQDFYEVPDLDPDQSLVLDRKQSILLLFNLNDPRFDSSSGEYSAEYVNLAMQFAEEIVKKQEYLDKHSDQIMAVTTTRVYYKGEMDTLRIILKQEVEEPDLVRWVISGVEADFLQVPHRDTTHIRFLSPVSHELGFMDLNKAFKEPDRVIDYTEKDFIYDPVGPFIQMIHGGTVVMDQVIQVQYKILFDVGFHAELSEVIINNELSGWCILNLCKTALPCVH